jgi:hypothetical protein
MRLFGCRITCLKCKRLAIEFKVGQSSHQCGCVMPYPLHNVEFVRNSKRLKVLVKPAAQI